MSTFPVSLDGKTVAMYSQADGKVGISILGHPAVHFDQENARKFIEYMTSVADYSRDTQQWVKAALPTTPRRSAQMKECNECFAYAKHEDWCDKTK